MEENYQRTIHALEGTIQELRGHLDVKSSKSFQDQAEIVQKLEEITKECEEHKLKRNLAKQEMMAVAKVIS